MTDLQTLWNALIQFEWKDLLAPVAGIFVVLLTQFTIAQIRKRELLDEYWERYAISEGIEPVLEFMSVLQHRIAKHSGFERVPDVQPYPVRALYHVTVICPTERLNEILMYAQQVDQYGVPGDYLRTFSKTMAEVAGLLTELARDLSDIKIAKKSDAYKIRERDDVKAVALKINQLVCDLLSVPDDNFPEELKVRKAKSFQEWEDALHKKIFDDEAEVD